MSDSQFASEGSCQPTRVVAAVIQRDGRYLVGLRPTGKKHSGMWEFPGGKVRDGETDLTAIRRELHEELGVHVQAVGRVLFTSTDPATGFQIDFIETTISGSPRSIEHDELLWAVVGDLAELPLAPSDSDLATYLASHQPEQ